MDLKTRFLLLGLANLTLLVPMCRAQTPGKAFITVQQPQTRPTESSASAEFTVDGNPAWILTNQGDSLATIAQEIATAFNGNSLVTAVASGSTVTLTAKTVGSSTNYPLTCAITNSGGYIAPFLLNCPPELSGGTGYTPEQAFIHPKFEILGVTYAPPGPSSYVQYTNSTTVGTTVTTASSFTSDVSNSVSIGGAISAWAIAGGKTVVTASQGNEWTQASTNTSTVTLSKQSTASEKTTGTANAYSPINHDYDIIWLWLNPLLIYTASGSQSGPISLAWNGYGYDAADQPDMDVYGVQVGYLNGHFGDNPSVDAVLQRSWSTGLTWPAGDSPAINATDIANILSADPFTAPTYTLPSPLPTTTPDGEFTAMQGFFDIPYEQAGLGNGGGLTTQYTLTNTDTASSSQQKTYTYKQSFGLDEAITTSINFVVFKVAFTADLKQSQTLTSTHSTQTTNSTTTALTNALSVTGPPCAQTSAPCVPTYTGPGEFVVYQDNMWGTFMFAPTN